MSSLRGCEWEEFEVFRVELTMMGVAVWRVWNENEWVEGTQTVGSEKMCCNCYFSGYKFIIPLPPFAAHSLVEPRARISYTFFCLYAEILRFYNVQYSPLWCCRRSSVCTLANKITKSPDGHENVNVGNVYDNLTNPSIICSFTCCVCSHPHCREWKWKWKQWKFCAVFTLKCHHHLTNPAEGFWL